MKALLALSLALIPAAPAAASPFVVRTAGAATTIAIDEGSVLKTGHYRTGWTYELYRERNPLRGVRPPATAGWASRPNSSCTLHSTAGPPSAP